MRISSEHSVSRKYSLIYVWLHVFKVRAGWFEIEKNRACLVFILQQPLCKQELVAVSCRAGCTDVQELSLACNVGNQEIRHVILKYGTLSITISSTS